MLWLASLMGLVGVGAASFAAVQLQETSEDEDDVAQADTNEDTEGLLDQIGGAESWLTARASAGLGSEASDHDLTEHRVSENALHDKNDDDILYAEIGREAAPDGDASNEADDDPLASADDADSQSDAPDTDLLIEWIAKGKPAEALDYEPETEVLMLVWDDLAEGAEEPDVSVETDPHDEDVRHVLMNGNSVAEIYGDPELTEADVTIIPLSSAMVAGFAPA
jgi:hypothetical protein